MVTGNQEEAGSQNRRSDEWEVVNLSSQFTMASHSTQAQNVHMMQSTAVAVLVGLIALVLLRSQPMAAPLQAILFRVAIGACWILWMIVLFLASATFRLFPNLLISWGSIWSLDHNESRMSQKDSEQILKDITKGLKRTSGFFEAAAISLIGPAAVLLIL